jgi:hypothetical protein
MIFLASFYELFERGDAFLLIECDGKKDRFHRVIAALVCGRLRVEADALKQPVEVHLIFAPQGAAEFRPPLSRLFDDLDKSRDGAAHDVPPESRSY